MAESRTVVGVEHSPIYVVSREPDVWSVSEEDYIPGVQLRELIKELREDQHVYLVHLGERGEGVNLTQLI